MQEPFLINPVRKRKKAVRRNKLPSGLLSKMMKKYGPGQGMKRAWASLSRNSWPKARAAHRTASLSGWRKRTKKKRGYAKPVGGTYPRYNPFGEEVLIVGANPVRKRCKRRVTRSKAAYLPKRKRRRNLVNPIAAVNPRRRRRKRNLVAAVNPRRRIRTYGVARRRRRRNPVSIRTVGLDINKPMSMIMPLGVGILSLIANERIPTVLNLSSFYMRLGAKVAITFGGGILLSKVKAIGKSNAAVWTIVGGVSIARSLLEKFVFKTSVSGLSAFPEEVEADLNGIGAFPEEIEGGVDGVNENEDKDIIEEVSTDSLGTPYEEYVASDY